MNVILSIDVEDWFHILDVKSAPSFGEWNSVSSLVEQNFLRMLDILDERKAVATCFILGWVAERYPDLVLEAKKRGHEIASHGYSHRLVYEMAEEEFYSDAVKSKHIIEDIIGHRVLGYRSSGFSVTERTPWFFDKLIEAGYFYDSSIFPARRQHGGIRSVQYAPYLVTRGNKRIFEFPITVKRVLGVPVCFFGGGYLRIFPSLIISKMTRQVLKEGRPVIIYVHPREIDPEHPRLEMGIIRRFKSYVNLHTTEGKIRCIIEEFKCGSFEQYLTEHTIDTEAY
jgi:polysaccharide deacetylase family protein (PEP-CTERM system associated)